MNTNMFNKKYAKQPKKWSSAAAHMLKSTIQCKK